MCSMASSHHLYNIESITKVYRSLDLQNNVIYLMFNFIVTASTMDVGDGALD